jgi:Fe-S cluster biogenesis protein NfuA
MEHMQIKGVPSRSADVFFFTASVELLPGQTTECSSAEEARGSELFENLFHLPWVIHAAAEGRALIVKKRPGSADWRVLAPEVAEIIRELHRQERPLFSKNFLKSIVQKKAGFETPIDQTKLNNPAARRIQEILDRSISPSLAMHGGKVTLVDLKDGKVYLSFGGGCQGCAQITNTVRDGVERLLLSEVSGLKGVVDVTNHTAGKNPFFRT